MSFSATFARSCSSAIRSMIVAVGGDDRLGLPSARARPRRAASCSRRAPGRSAAAGRRRTRRASRRRRSATAPSRMPCRRTRRCTRGLSAAARMPFRTPALTAPVSCATSSQSFTSRMRRSISVRWPSPASIRASTPGMRAASHRPCDTGHETIVLAVQQEHRPVDRADVEAPRPQRTRGRRRASRRRRARARGGRISSMYSANAPVSTARSSAPSSVAMQPHQVLRLRRRASRRASARGRRAAPPRPRAPSRTRRGSPRPCPSSQSSPSASYGATAARLATATSRSSQSAAQASTCGPPPEMPQLP